MDLQGVQTFGRGGTIVRSQAGVPLSLDMILQHVPGHCQLVYADLGIRERRGRRTFLSSLMRPMPCP
jgi:hypothetical protein